MKGMEQNPTSNKSLSIETQPKTFKIKILGSMSQVHNMFAIVNTIINKVVSQR